MIIEKFKHSTVLLCALMIAVEFVLTVDYFASFLMSLSLILFCLYIQFVSSRYSDMVLLAVWSKLLLFPFLLKLMNFESVVSQMRSEGGVAILVLIASCCIFFAAFLIRWGFDFKGKIVLSVKDGNVASLAVVMFGVGYFFMFLHALFRPSLIDGGGEDGFGGFGSLTSVAYLGIVLYMYKYRESVLRFDVFVVSGFFLMVFLSVISNTKHEMFTFGIAMVLSCVFFRIKLSMRDATVVVLSAVFLVVLVVPIIQSSRTLEYREMDVTDKLQYLANIDATVSNERFGYLPSTGSMVDRLDILEETDLIYDGVNTYGYVGWYPMYDALYKVLPSFVVGRKSPESSADILMWDIREKSVGILARKTPGLVASIYSVSGYVLFVPLFLLVILLIILPVVYLFGGVLYGNVLSVFFLVKYILYYTEKPADALLAIMIRDFSITTLQLCLVVFLYGLFVKGAFIGRKVGV